MLKVGPVAKVQKFFVNINICVSVEQVDVTFVSENF